MSPTFTTSLACQLALLVLFLVVVVGWWSYFGFLRWPPLAVALPRISVVTITRPDAQYHRAGRGMEQHTNATSIHQSIRDCK
jgi:hypothetical protein